MAVANISRRVAQLPRADPATLTRLGPPAVLAALVGLYVAVFGHLTWRQHVNWRSFGFDTGIYDQGMWLLSQGRDPFLTMRGMDYWGHHVAIIGYLFAPIYWLGGGVEVVTLAHTAWVAAGAVPLWLLARDRWAEPAGSGGTVQPAGSGGTVQPAGSGGTVQPAGSGGTVQPAGSGGTVQPAGSGGTVQPAGSGGTRQPAGSRRALHLRRRRWFAGSGGTVRPAGRGRGWVALAVPVAYLLHPAVNWVTWWLYHPDSMAITPLLFAWWLARAERWRWFAVACGVAMACKEDVSLAILVLGLVLAIRGQRRAGALTALAGAAWFLFCSKVVIPLRNDNAPAFYESYFPSLGASLGEILRNLVFHPSRAITLLSRPRVPDYALKMLGPVGFVAPFLAPLAFVVAGPQLGVNLLVEVQDGATIRSQYASLPIVGVFLGVVEGTALLRRRPRLLRAAAVWLVGCAVVGSHLWGLGPFSRAFDTGVWGDRPRVNLTQLERATAMVPADAGVAASWDVVTQFTRRSVVYEYPNPWLSSNYGPTGNDVGDPTTVDWIVVDRTALGSKDLALLTRLLNPSGGFRVVQDEAGVMVASRVAAGSLIPP